MRLTLAHHGGLAAGINLSRPPRTVDTRDLPKDEAAELSRLVDRAIAAGTHQPGGSAAARDAMSYTITVDRDGSTTTLTGSDTAESAEFADLLAWLEAQLS